MHKSASPVAKRPRVHIADALGIKRPVQAAQSVAIEVADSPSPQKAPAAAPTSPVRATRGRGRGRGAQPLASPRRGQPPPSPGRTVAAFLSPGRGNQDNMGDLAMSPGRRVRRMSKSSPVPVDRSADMELVGMPPLSLPPTAEQTKVQPKSARTVEQTYQKKTQLEHVLLRPDSYVGSTERQSQEMWLLQSDVSGAGAAGLASSSVGSTCSGAGVQSQRKMVRRKIDYVPALYKIFDEILVNAADNLIRDPSMDTIKVTIDTKRCVISVWNNGRGLPVEMHAEQKCYVPDMVFGQLLTSDNYDDSEKKVVGGRNGYGAKLTNIFSRRFTVETVDSSRKKRYSQTWRKNMSEREEPVIKPCRSGDSDFTCVTFEPDLSRFGMRVLEEDIAAVMRRRAYDIAASTRGRCKVYLDEELLEVSSFLDYVGLFLEPDDFRVCETCNDRWEVAVALTDGSGFQQVSMVNSICTPRGGTHVVYVTEQVTSALMDGLSKQKGEKGQKGLLMVKPQHVKNYLWIFVNCLIENPAFDSQSKETLTSKRDRFGSTCELPASLLDAVLGSGVLEAVTAWSLALGKSELARHLNKSDNGLRSRLFGIPKLEDANKAGTKDSGQCTLIITEGDSAKALAVAGLGVVGRDYYGVFPLRGKLRNVREMTVKQMMENKEIDQLMTILALDATKEYSGVQGLRYGSLCIMADQDFDGSHIKGLVINLIQHWFPSLLRLPTFVKEFVTPIVKVTRADEVVTFFTVQEYGEWKKINNDGQGWKTKYYKGLGTSTSAEARDYFSDLEQHELQFAHSGNDEDDDLIDMAFNSKRADDRKDWIDKCDENLFVDHSQPIITYGDFVNKELVHFAKYDVERAIPSLVDGLKPGQRKVLYGAFLKRLSTDIKVAQFAGYVAEKSAYHHGEVSLQGTIVGMAQTYVGSNNINLLLPLGQFGTRLQGGKDHAAARYIFTKLSPVTRYMFVEDDDAVLDYLMDEGQSIEPSWYCPVIPMVLVNGAEGIGTGWSTSVPNYNPRDIIANLRRHLRNEPLEPMMPWYKGFRGAITARPGEGAGKFESSGIAARRGPTKVDVTELPVKRWTQDYKEWVLEQLPQTAEQKRPFITEFKEHHTDNAVHFSLTMAPDMLAKAENKGIEKSLHLRSGLSTTNMFLFDSKGQLKKYASPEEVLTEFAEVRLGVYQKRKDHHIARLSRECAVLSDKARFVRLVVDGHLEIGQRPTAEVCAEMRRHGLRTMTDIQEGREPPDQSQKKRLRSAGDAPANVDNLSGPNGYGYLLKLKLWMLTAEKVAQLEEQCRLKTTTLEELKATGLSQLWDRDLVNLEQALDAREAAELKDHRDTEKLMKKATKGQVAETDNTVNRQCVLVFSKSFSEIKRVPTDQWRASRRGGRGQTTVSRARKKNAQQDEENNADEGDEDEADGEAGEEESNDAISGAFACHEFDALLAFTEHGCVHTLQALDVPLRKRCVQGEQISALLPDIGAGHRIVAVITVPQGALKHSGEGFAILVSKMGMAKKVAVSSFGVVRPGKVSKAFQLNDGDELRWVHRASAEDLLVLGAEDGKVLMFPIRTGFSSPSSLRAGGRPAMRLGNSIMASCDIARPDPAEVAKDAPLGSLEVAQPKKNMSGFMMFLKEEKVAPGQGGTKWKELGDQGQQKYRDMAEELKKQALAGNGPQALGDAVVGSVGASNASSTAVTTPASNFFGCRKRANKVCDDDDSANEADEAAAKKPEDAVVAIKEEEDEAADVDEDEDGGADDQDEEDDEAAGETTALAGTTGKCAKQAPSYLLGLSVLLVSRGGWGKRVCLADVRLRKRNQVGQVCMKFHGRDALAIVCVASSEKTPSALRRPIEPHLAFNEERSLAMQQQEQQPLPQGIDAPEPDFLAIFNALSEAERAPFILRHEQEQKTFEVAQEARKKHVRELQSKLGQILICTVAGLAARVNVASIDVKKRGNTGAPLLKVAKPDVVCAASIISSVDGERFDEAGDATMASDEAKPKAISAYKLFQQIEKVGDISAAAAKWKEIGEQGQQKYRDMAEELKEKAVASGEPSV